MFLFLIFTFILGIVCMLCVYDGTSQLGCFYHMLSLLPVKTNLWFKKSWFHTDA